MREITIREATSQDREAIFSVEEAAFERTDEAELVDALVNEGSSVLELVAERDGVIVGHILFSRLIVENEVEQFKAVSLAPIAVLPSIQGHGIGTALVEEAHQRLQQAGERLSIVLGDPEYYGRFGYHRNLAACFESDFQCDALQATHWDKDAPVTGRLIYAPAFAGI